MKGKRSKAAVSYNMSRIRSEGSKIEIKLEEMLKRLSYEYVKHPKIFGKPDFAFLEYKIAIFADSEFWHGYCWQKRKLEIKTNVDFWVAKIERNIERDAGVTSKLQGSGWIVVRLWGHEILKEPQYCEDKIKEALKKSMKA
jgi:DNA mismatch endonuclease, patch repair protein